MKSNDAAKQQLEKEYEADHLIKWRREDGTRDMVPGTIC